VVTREGSWGKKGSKLALAKNHPTANTGKRERVKGTAREIPLSKPERSMVAEKDSQPVYYQSGKATSERKSHTRKGLCWLKLRAAADYS